MKRSILVSLFAVSPVFAGLPTMRDAEASGHPVLFVLFVIVMVGFACWWNNRK